MNYGSCFVVKVLDDEETRRTMTRRPSRN